MKGILCIVNNDKKEKLSFLNLPVKETKILERSIDKFNDSDPCIINYTICSKELSLELLSLLKKEKLGEYNVDTLPDIFKDYVDISKLKNIKSSTIFYFI